MILTRCRVFVGVLAVSLLAAVVQAGSSQAAVKANRYETEALPVVASSGKPYIGSSACDTGSCSSYAATAAGDFITYGLDVREARTYDVSVVLKKNNVRGIFQLAIQGAPNALYDGTFRDLGESVDSYAPETTYDTVNVGRVSFGTAGLKRFRFTEVGKNPQSRGYQLVTDAIVLTPVVTLPATTTTAPTTTTTTVPSFVLGTTKPDATNTGVPLGTMLTPHNGNITVTQAGTVLDSLDVHGTVYVQAANVTIKDSIIRGGSDTTNSGVINATSASVKNLTIENNMLVPQTPSIYLDGVLGHDYTAVRNHVYNVTDGFGVYNSAKTVDGTYVNAAANVVIEGNYVHDLFYYAPDPNHSDGHTHNDDIQIQGNSDITIVGNTLNATTSSVGMTSPYGSSVTGSAIAITPNVGAVTATIIDRNWLDYGAQSITVIKGNFDTSTSVLITNNSFGDHQPFITKSGVAAQRPIMIDASLAAAAPKMSSGNVNFDGSPAAMFRLVNAA